MSGKFQLKALDLKTLHTNAKSFFECSSCPFNEVQIFNTSKLSMNQSASILKRNVIIHYLNCFLKTPRKNHGTHFIFVCTLMSGQAGSKQNCQSLLNNNHCNDITSICNMVQPKLTMAQLSFYKHTTISLIISPHKVHCSSFRSLAKHLSLNPIHLRFPKFLKLQI